MKYTVKWSDRAQKQISKLNKSISEMLVRWVYKNLNDCEEPRQRGKGLTANRSGQWRYRVGDYRIIAEIKDDELIILVIEVGHRKSVYDD
ncbi:MAG: type II toxin-antitoxin system RelE/ParE family toxin [Roseburia sp.]|nr:type II toxin-antitoxin system RelE/ParE family toxin [Roseburia sp.]